MEKFVEILENINSKMLELKEVLLKKQSALVYGKHSEIGETIAQEQELMAQIVRLEQSRIEELKLIKKEYSLSEDTNKLEDLIAVLGQSLPQGIMERLVFLRNSIKSNNENLRKINNQNGDLINNVRQFIRMLFTNIRDAKNSCLINARV